MDEPRSELTLDLLEERREKLEAAEKRIAELEKQVTDLQATGTRLENARRLAVARCQALQRYHEILHLELPVMLIAKEQSSSLTGDSIKTIGNKVADMIDEMARGHDQLLVDVWSEAALVARQFVEASKQPLGELAPMIVLPTDDVNTEYAEAEYPPTVRTTLHHDRATTVFIRNWVGRFKIALGIKD